MFDIVKAIHEALHTESTWIFVICIALGMGIAGGGLAWLIDRGYKNAQKERRVSARTEAEPTRRDLYVKLSRQKTDNDQIYSAEWFIQLKFITADAEANNKHLMEAQRREKGDEARKQLEALDAMRQGPIAQHQRELAETIAQIKLSFPKEKELDWLLNGATQRPLYDIQDPPPCDTRNMPCMQAWADVEAKKAETAIHESTQRLAAVLAYIEAHMDD